MDGKNTSFALNQLTINFQIPIPYLPLINRITKSPFITFGDLTVSPGTIRKINTNFIQLMKQFLNSSEEKRLAHERREFWQTH